MSEVEKKYELLKNDTIKVFGHTLYRIRALRDFKDVKKGDLGGYIEREKAIFLMKVIVGYIIKLEYMVMLEYVIMLKYMEIVGYMIRLRYMIMLKYLVMLKYMDILDYDMMLLYHQMMIIIL